VNDVNEITKIAARVRAAAGLPDLLRAGFDAFEIARLAARAAITRHRNCLPRS